MIKQRENIVNSRKNVLVLVAHPDDEVIGCAGTIAKYTNTGNPVHVVYLADGLSARYQSGEFIDPKEYAARKQAVNKAAKILGVSSVTFGNFPDNRMDSIELLEVVKFVELQIGKHKPEIVLTHHSSDLNIDHRIVNQAVVTACRPQPGFSVQTLLFFEVCSSTEWQTIPVVPFAPNWFVDITEYLDIRKQALEAYSMELRFWPHSRSLKAMTHLAHWRGASIGVDAAEAFMLGRRID